MPAIRLIFLWHMHQPYYKDLATGEYRLPWVRMHALKDYYGMVKLLDEFPNVHQNFNLVPSLLSQLQEYVSGTARDPFLEVASRPAADLTLAEKQFAVRYLFQANATHLIGRYPRYQQLFQQLADHQYDAAAAASHFSEQDIRDLQVLSQLSWFDEFFLERPEVASLIAKQRDFSLDDQKAMLSVQRELLAAVIPAYRSAAQRGGIEISTSPFYHPILPLLCDTDQGAVSSPGLPLPSSRFQHPEDASEQLRRALELHESTFGIRPRGVWPSEGSVSEEVLGLAQQLGAQWMATDEGVLGRSLGAYFQRGRDEVLIPECAQSLYTIYRYSAGDSPVHMVFRDHSLSDLIGFVYSGMPAQDAVEHFLHRLRSGCAPILQQGRDAVVSVILDGENAWEFYPGSGREFLRRLYDAISRDAGIEAVTVSEAIARHKEEHFGRIDRIVPGSWINSNFNVWIGAPEDNKSWDYLSEARNFYEKNAEQADPARRELAHEELLIAEGSDWNWWYGPEHHSANDADFDELYRKHLTNIYIALGASPPEYLAQPIGTGSAASQFTPQTGYIHPKLDGLTFGYFEWLGAARYAADNRDSAMHGRRRLLNTLYAAVDESALYYRVDFTDDLLQWDKTSNEERVSGDFTLVLFAERASTSGAAAASLTITLEVVAGEIVKATQASGSQSPAPPASDGATSAAAASFAANGRPSAVTHAEAHLRRVLEGKLLLGDLEAQTGDTVNLRVSVWQEQLPMDALPAEGNVSIKVVSEAELSAAADREHWHV